MKKILNMFTVVEIFYSWSLNKMNTRKQMTFKENILFVEIISYLKNEKKKFP